MLLKRVKKVTVYLSFSMMEAIPDNFYVMPFTTFYILSLFASFIFLVISIWFDGKSSNNKSSVINFV